MRAGCRSVILPFLSWCLLFTLSLPVASADESTAHLLFKKTASVPQDATQYVVKPGDLLSKIVSQQFGALSPAKEKALYKTLRSLNPKLKDKDRIYPGQVLVLPASTDVETAEDQPADPSAYKTKKGDTLFGIIHRKFGVKGATAAKTLKVVKQLNPGITNVNRIYPGQMLKLPEGGKLVTPEDYDRLDEEKKTAAIQLEQSSEKAILPSESRLDVIREVLARMNGTLTTTGFYYIPIPDMGQATIDCSMIPVVEFDDGSTVMLDFTKRMNDTLKKAIESKWGNIAMVKVGSSDDSASILSKAINASRAYIMTRQVRPSVLGKDLAVSVSVDWIISKKQADDKPYRQAFTLLTDKSLALPKAVLTFAERNGLSITDVDHDVIISDAADEKSAEKSASAPMTVLNASNDGEVVDVLLTTLGYKVEKDAEIRIFDTSSNGFNLAVKADYLSYIPAAAVPARTTVRQPETTAPADKKWGVLLTAPAKTNIRASRALNARLKGQLEAGQKVKGDFLENNWYAVFKADETVRDLGRSLGYVYAPRLTAVSIKENSELPTVPPAESKDTPAEKKSESMEQEKEKDWGQMMTAEARTNIRARRSLSSGLKGRLEAGQQIKTDFLDNDWYAVFALDEKNRDEKKALGYVYAPRLKRSVENTAAPQKAESPKPPKTEGPGPSPVERKIIFQSKKLPQQFVAMLREKGTEIVYINQGDAKRDLIGKILRALNLNAAFSPHLFLVPENSSTPRATINLPAFQVSTPGGSMYLVDYSVDSDIYGLLHERWGVNIIKF